jgi:hypothetical protein
MRINGYRNFLNEKRKADMTPEEREKADAASRKATATKGQEEVREDQVAAIYMIAKNKLKSIGLSSVDQAEFPAYLDMKANTYAHTLKKVENLIADAAGSMRKHSNEGDVFKYAEMVGKFQKMDDDDLQDLALQALEGGKQRAAKRSENEKKSKEDAKASNAKLVNAISDYVRSGVDAKKAVQAVAKSKGLDAEDVQAAWDSRMNESFGPKSGSNLPDMLDARFDDYLSDVEDAFKDAGCKAVSRTGNFGGEVKFKFKYSGMEFNVKLINDNKSMYAKDASKYITSDADVESLLKKLKAYAGKCAEDKNRMRK